MRLDDPSMHEARGLLRRHGLPDGPLRAGTAYSNLVWLTPEFVIRLSDGHLHGAFHHEAQLLRQLTHVLPVPDVLHVGNRTVGGEYLILRRLHGTNLEDAWPTLTASERVGVLTELGSLLRTLHALPHQAWMANPWVDDALRRSRFAAGNHTPPAYYRALIASAAVVRPDLSETLLAAERFIADRLAAFDGDTDVLVHGDIHFRNVMVAGGHVTALLDFEGAMPAPADVELGKLLREVRPPAGSDPGLYLGAAGSLRVAYPELFAHPELERRLEVYEAIWQLVRLLPWRRQDVPVAAARHPGPPELARQASPPDTARQVAADDATPQLEEDPARHLARLHAGEFRAHLRRRLREDPIDAGV